MASGDVLMRSLGAGVNGPERIAPARSGASGSNPAGLEFATMLDQARAGTLDSGLPVRIAKSSGVKLSDEQLARLAPVVDRLHAGGASHALIAIDGRLVKVDVITREVREEFDPSAQEVMDGIDAVASAPAGQAALSEAVGVPHVGVLGPSLSRALGRDDGSGDE